MCDRQFKDMNPNMKTTKTTTSGGASEVCANDGLEGPLSYEYKPDKFEKFVLDYTASTTWEQIRDLDWTTAEMLDLVKKYMDKNKAD